MNVLDFWQSHAAEVTQLLGEHVALVIVSTLVAVAAGVPVGIAAARRPRIGGPLATFASVVQTVPSLAMFGFLLPLPLVGGIGARTALVALVLYALLPIVRTTVAGLRGIDPAILEAADAMGMTPRQRLRQVELPLALPAIVAGIRVSAVVGVGTVTIAAAIGAGGLGAYIYRGLSMVDSTVILAGAIPAAALALLVDGVLLGVERLLAARREAGRLRRAAVAAAMVLLAGGAAASAASGGGDRIVIGSKNFTEQVILGELVAQTLERHTDLPVERRLNLGGTFICDTALQSGDIDIYVEYSGTALTAIFKQPVRNDPAAVLEDVRTRYADSGRTLLAPLGFNNTFAVLVRGAEARVVGLRTVSDVIPHAPRWRAGFGFEFMAREDGYPGLAAAYGLRFATPPRPMDVSLIYLALSTGQVDLIVGDATAGLIDALDLVALEDDRRYFPPYDAVPVVHTQTLLAHPEIRGALDRLAGRIDAVAMRRMNNAVDADKRDPADVVREFLETIE